MNALQNRTHCKKGNEECFTRTSCTENSRIAVIEKSPVVKIKVDWRLRLVVYPHKNAGRMRYFRVIKRVTGCQALRVKVSVIPGQPGLCIGQSAVVS